MTIADIIRTDFANRPQGFNAREVPGAMRGVISAIERGVKNGWLHRAKLDYHHVRYFGDLRLAVEFEAANKRNHVQAKFNSRPRAVRMQDTGPATTPAGIEIQRLPTPSPRFHVPDSFVGELQQLGIGRYAA